VCGSETSRQRGREEERGGRGREAGWKLKENLTKQVQSHAHTWGRSPSELHRGEIWSWELIDDCRGVILGKGASKGGMSQGGELLPHPSCSRPDPQVNPPFPCWM
jgi:hypothetical protein